MTTRRTVLAGLVGAAMPLKAQSMQPFLGMDLAKGSDVTSFASFRFGELIEIEEFAKRWRWMSVQHNANAPTSETLT